MVTLEVALRERDKANKRYRQALESDEKPENMGELVRNWMQWVEIVKNLNQKIYVVRQLSVGNFEEVEMTVDRVMSFYGHLEPVRSFIELDQVHTLIHIDGQPIAFGSSRSTARLRMMDYLIQQTKSKTRVGIKV